LTPPLADGEGVCSHIETATPGAQTMVRRTVRWAPDCRRRFGLFEITVKCVYCFFRYLFWYRTDRRGGLSPPEGNHQRHEQSER